MIYLFYFASLLFTPIMALFEVTTILLITFHFFIVTYGYTWYFKTGNSISDAIQASMLVTLACQLCYIVSHIDIITSVNYPLHAFTFLTFMSVLFSLMKNTHLNTATASVTTVTGLGAVFVTMPSLVASALPIG